MSEVDIGKLLEQFPVKTYATTALLPTTYVAAGSLARVTADGFLYMYSGSAWAIVGGSGTHNHAASEITTGQLAVARGGTALNTSATVQGTILYFNGVGTMAELTPGAVGTFLKSGGASANVSWDTPGISSHTLDSHSDVPAITEAQGEILYHNGTNWVPLAVGTSGMFLKTQGASANPVWANATVVVDQVTANTTVGASSTAEQTMYSKSVAAGTIGTDGRLQLYIRGIFDARSGTCTIRLKLGVTTIATLVITYAGVDDDQPFEIYANICGDAATNAQLGSLSYQLNNAVNATPATAFIAGTSAIDTTAAATLLVSVQMSASDANNNMIIQYASLTLDT